MKTIYHILFSLLFVLAFVGCDDDDDKVIERNQLKLTASAQSATLTPDALVRAFKIGRASCRERV